MGIAHCLSCRFFVPIGGETVRRCGEDPDAIEAVSWEYREEARSEMTKGRRTSPWAAKAASKVLRDGRTSRSSKTAAGSALSQRAPKKKRK